MSLIGRLDTSVDTSIRTSQNSTLVFEAPRLNTRRALFRANVSGDKFNNINGPTRQIHAALFQHIRTKKNTTIRHAWVTVENTSAPTIVVFDLVKLAPVFSNFAGNILKVPAFMASNNPNISPANSGADNLDPILTQNPSPVPALTEFGIIGSTEFNLGTTVNNPTTSPQDLNWRDLLNPVGNSQIPVGGLLLPRGQDGGFAIVIDIDMTANVTFGAYFEYSEIEAF